MWSLFAQGPLQTGEQWVPQQSWRSFSTSCYGSEKVDNALRLAIKLQQEHAEAQVRIFLLGDAVASALPGQTTPQGYYNNVERMLRAVAGRHGLVRACGTCVEARGLEKLALVERVEVGTMSELAQWVAESDKVLMF